MYEEKSFLLNVVKETINASDHKISPLNNLTQRC